MSSLPPTGGEAALWATVRRMLTADLPPTLQLGVTLDGGRYARIVSAPRGRGVPGESFTVAARTLPDLFLALAQALDDTP